MLDAFLDGTLPPREHARMLRRLAAEPRLRAERERQASLDASLTRLFSPPAPLTPPAEESPSPPRRAAPRTAPRQRQRLRLAAMAAIIVIGFGYAGWTLTDFVLSNSIFGTQAPYAPRASQDPTTFVAAYHAIVGGGFQPDWVCQTDAQFADAFRRQLGQPMLFHPDPPAVVMTGLSYRWVLSPNTLVFLGTVRGTQALVFADRAERDQSYTLPADSGLHLFRKQIGALVLYELTPLNEPVLLNHFEPNLALCP